MMLARMQMISQAIWEPLGGIFAFAMGCLLLRILFGNARKNFWVWSLLLGVFYAFFWRVKCYISGVRYHNIFLFFALFGIIGLWEKFPLPRKWKNFLFIILLGVCIGRDLMFNPQDQEILRLYQQIRQDSQRFPRSIGLSYDGQASRETYYTKLPIVSPDRPIPLPDLLKNLKNNLAVYDGDFDAVYLFCSIGKEENKFYPEFLKLASETQISEIGGCYYDRHRKKKLIVCRYLPSFQLKLVGGGELIFNGNFEQLMSEKEKREWINTLGKRMNRLRSDFCELPAGWRFYQSWTRHTKAFAARIRKDGHYALRLEADGYLSAMPKLFAVNTEKILSFSVYAEKDSMLQLTRSSRSIGMLPFLLLPLKAGQDRRFEIKLSPYANREKNEIWFWLDHGTIELSDVRLK